MGQDQQYKYAVLAREEISGWVEGRALRKLSSSAIANFFVDNVLARFGVIAEVRSDQGPEFKGRFHDLLMEYGIKHKMTNAYHPQANGFVERGNGPVKEAIFKLCGENTHKWHHYMPYALWADRITSRATTGHTPYYLLYGQECVLPVDVEFETFYISNWDSIRTTEDLLAARLRQLLRHTEDVENARDYLKRNRDKTVELHNERHQRSQMHRDLTVGDLVLVRNSKQDQTHVVRREARYLGPYRIVGITQGNTYELAELDGSPIRDPNLKVGHNRIRRFFSRPAEVEPLDPRRLPRQDAVIVPPLTSVLSRARSVEPRAQDSTPGQVKRAPLAIVRPTSTIIQPQTVVRADEDSGNRRNPGRTARLPTDERLLPIVAPPVYQKVNRPGWKGYVLVHDPSSV